MGRVPAVEGILYTPQNSRCRHRLSKDGVASLRFVPEMWRSISKDTRPENIVQELCESRDGRPGLSVLTSLLVSGDVKNY